MLIVFNKKQPVCNNKCYVDICRIMGMEKATVHKCTENHVFSLVCANGCVDLCCDDEILDTKPATIKTIQLLCSRTFGINFDTDFFNIKK